MNLKAGSILWPCLLETLLKFMDLMNVWSSLGEYSWNKDFTESKNGLLTIVEFPFLVIFKLVWALVVFTASARG